MNTLIFENSHQIRNFVSPVSVSTQSNLVLRKTRQELEDMGINYVGYKNP